MSFVPRLHRYTYADYVSLEMNSDTRHEFLDGEIYAMSGGSDEHAALAFETLHALRSSLGSRACRVYGSDLRIRVEAVDLSTYPDGSVICGLLQKYEPGPETTALNPMILLEVTSNSSEEHDTGAKYEYYRTIPTLRDYIIVSHRERRITVHSRGAGDEWTTQSAGSGERVAVSSLDAELSVEEIYRNSTVGR